MKKMKKGMKLLSMSMALMMVLSLVLSTVVFVPVSAATNVTVDSTVVNEDGSTTITKIYTYNVVDDAGNAVTNYDDDTQKFFYLIPGWTYSGTTTYYQKNATRKGFGFRSTEKIKTGYPSGGVLMPLPVDEFEMKGAVINSAKLNVWFYGASTGSNTRIAFSEVSDAENTKIRSGATELYTNDDGVQTANDYTPVNVKNYVDGAGLTPEDGVSDVVLKRPVQTNATGADGTIVLTAGTDSTPYHYSFDITDIVADGSLSKERHLLLQKTVNSTSNSNRQIYAYMYDAEEHPMTLTITYTLPQKATEIDTDYSLLDSSTAMVEMETGYGYQINFDGELSPDTVTSENVLLTDSDGGTDATIGYTVEVSDDNKSIIVKFPYDDGTKDYDSDGNGSIDAYYKWLTAGETYHITLTNGLKNAWDEVLYENGHTIQVTMSDAIEHGVRLNQIRWAENGTTGSVPSTNVLDEEITVGAHGTVKGEMLWGYGQYYNFTAHGTPILGMIVVYDEDKNMKQATAYSINADRNMRSGYLTPRLTLNESLVAGDTIKFFVWNGYDPLRTDGSYATGMKTISVVE